jgi:hypothetical protein
VADDTRSVADALDEVLASAADVVAGNANSAHSELSVQGKELDATGAMVAQALAFARSVAQQIEQFETESNKKMDLSLANAQALVERLQTAIGWDGTQMERAVARDGAQMEYLINGDGSKAKMLAGETAGATESALESVSKFQETLNWMLGTQQADAAAVAHNVTAFGADLEDTYGQADKAGEHAQAALNSSMGLEQRVTQFQLQKVRDFVGAVRDSWLAYVDNQKAKFDKMDDADKANLASYSRIAENGLRDGRQQLTASNTSLATAIDSLNGERLKFADFDSLLHATAGNTTTGIAALVQESTDESTSLQTQISEIRSNMTAHDAEERASASSRISSFEASLDDIENRILESVA